MNKPLFTKNVSYYDWLTQNLLIVKLPYIQVEN